jgi:hypothetical protein
VNTSEHTKTTIDGGRNGGQNHSLTKRIGGETKIRAAMLRLDAAFKAHLGSTMSELGAAGWHSWCLSSRRYLGMVLVATSAPGTQSVKRGGHDSQAGRPLDPA